MSGKKNEKIVMVRKDHTCWATGKTIKKGEKDKVRKYYPAEAERMGMIDVWHPITLYIKIEDSNDKELQ